MSDIAKKPSVLNEALTRRSLLEATALGLVATLAAPLSAACGPGSSETPDAGGPVPDGGGPLGDGGCAQATCKVDANTLVLPLSEHPELVPVLGWKIYDNALYTDPVCGSNSLLVIQTAKGQYSAVSASCTHACCTVQLSTDSSGNPEFFCPCHRSTFNVQGQRTGGPARQDLPTLPVCFDGCTVYVQMGS